VQTELELLLRGQGEKWTRECILDAIKCDHGYSKQSSAVQFLVSVLSELSPVDQRKFLRFVTGSPRLPTGGLAALRPRLTIVKKHSGTCSFCEVVMHSCGDNC
jgi:E3 ubiquitin-protein ligase TRIP12